MSLLLFFRRRRASLLAEIEVDRNPDRAADAFPRLRLYDGGHTILQHGRGSYLVRTEAQVECMVAASSADGLALAWAPLSARVVKAVLADRSLAGTAETIAETGFAVEIGAERYTTPTACLTLGFAIEHEARAADFGIRGRRAVLAALEAVLRAPLPTVGALPYHERIAAEIAVRLAAGLPGTPVYRNALRAIDLTEDSQAVILRDDEETVSTGTTGAAAREALFRVELPVTAPTDNATGDVANTLADAVRAALAPDPQLGGLAAEFLEQESDAADVDPDAEFAGPALGLSLTYAARFFTAERDPTALPVWAAA